MKKLLVILVGVLLLTSCKDKNEYEQYFVNEIVPTFINPKSYEKISIEKDYDFTVEERIPSEIYNLKLKTEIDSLNILKYEIDLSDIKYESTYNNSDFDKKFRKEYIESITACIDIYKHNFNDKKNKILRLNDILKNYPKDYIYTTSYTIKFTIMSRSGAIIPVKCYIYYNHITKEYDHSELKKFDII